MYNVGFCVDVADQVIELFCGLDHCQSNSRRQNQPHPSQQNSRVLQRVLIGKNDTLFNGANDGLEIHFPPSGLLSSRDGKADSHQKIVREHIQLLGNDRVLSKNFG